MIEDGTYEIAPSSRAKIVARAPGHDFEAAGTGLKGKAVVEGGTVTSAEASFPLWMLDAGDMLANRELKKFLGLKNKPTIRGKISGPIPMTERADGFSGAGEITVELEGRPTKPIPIRFEGSAKAVTIHLDASFTRFGHKPPKLLFIKVKDEFQLTLDCRLERE